MQLCQIVQGVLAASQEGKPVSKQMVKWTGVVKLESVILVEAVVGKPLEPAKSCTISGFELHIQKLYCTMLHLHQILCYFQLRRLRELPVTLTRMSF